MKICVVANTSKKLKMNKVNTERHARWKVHSFIRENKVLVVPILWT